MTGEDNLVLYYFNTPGRAELIRAALFIGGIKYEDKRFTHEEWASIKPKMPFGQVPALQIGTKIIGESIAIARYVAARANLLPKSLEEQAISDSYIQGLASMLNESTLLGKQYKDKPEEERKAAMKEHIEKKLVPQWKLIDKFMPDTAEGFYFGDLTIADLHTFSAVNQTKGMEKWGCPKPDFLDELPRTMKCYEAVAKHPKMVEYLEYKKSKNLE